MVSAQIWIRMRMEALALWQMSCGSPPSGTSGGIEQKDMSMKEYLNTNFSDIVYGENGFLVELRCNNTFQVQLFGKIKAYLLENQPAWKAAGAIPIPDAVAIFNLIDQLAGGNRFWGEETGRQAEDALFELQEIIGSLEESPECE